MFGVMNFVMNCSHYIHLRFHIKIQCEVWTVLYNRAVYQCFWNQVGPRVFTDEKLYWAAIYLSSSIILTTMKFYFIMKTWFLIGNTVKVWQNFKKICMFCQPCNMAEVFWNLITEHQTVHDCQLVHLALDGCIDQSGGFFQKSFVAPAHLLVAIFDASTSNLTTFDTF